MGKLCVLSLSKGVMNYWRMISDFGNKIFMVLVSNYLWFWYQMVSVSNRCWFGRFKFNGKRLVVLCQMTGIYIFCQIKLDHIEK